MMKTGTNRIICHLTLMFNVTLIFSSIIQAQTISMGDGYCYMICPDSTVTAIGNNNYGQLGDSTYFNKSTPVKVKHLDNVVAVSAPGVMALKNDGTVWRWSWNGEYRMQKVDISDVVAINSCDRFMGSISFAIKRDGTLWTWTNNYGSGDIQPENPTPQRVPGISDVVLIKCSSGFNVIMAMCRDGSVFIWGTCPEILTPRQVNYFTDVKEVAAGSGMYYFLRNDGTVWSFGLMYSATCSLGNPRQINISNVSSIEAQESTLFMIKDDGTLWAWGYSSDYLGVGNSNQDLVPMQVIGIEDVEEVTTNGRVTSVTNLARTTDGVVWGWGYNYFGELGDSTNHSKLFAERIDLACTGTDCYEKYPDPITVVFDTIVEIGTVVELTSSQSQLYNWQYSWHDWEEWYDNRQTFRAFMENKGRHFFASLIDSSGCYRYEQFNVYSICDTLVKVKDRLMLDTSLVPGSRITLTASEAESYFWYPWSNMQTNTLFVSTDIESVATLTDETGCERTERFMLRVACDNSTLTNPLVAMDTTTFRGETLILSSTPGVHTLWEPNFGLSCTDCPNPEVQVNGPGTYIATITDIYNCVQKEKFIIRIPDCDTIVKNENIIVMDTIVQPGTTIQLHASDALTYSWAPRSGLSCYQCKSPFAVNVLNTTYTVTVTDKYHCNHTEQFIIENYCDTSTFDNPQVVMDTITYPSAVIELHARNAISYIWTQNSALTCLDCQEPNVRADAPLELTVSSTDRYGCVIKEKFLIKIRDCDTIIIQDHILKLDTIIHYPTDIELRVSESFNGYNWNSIDELSCSDCPDPILHARTSSTYIVELSDIWHCPFSEEFRITVLFEEIEIPDLISPNGDGINDVFEIRGLIPGTMLSIFDNNGILIYENKNYSNDWNGRRNDGELLSDGTYWYILNVPGMKAYKGWVYIKSN